jgi:hypothetical protein
LKQKSARGSRDRRCLTVGHGGSERLRNGLAARTRLDLAMGHYGDWNGRAMTAGELRKALEPEDNAG